MKEGEPILGGPQANPGTTNMPNPSVRPIISSGARPIVSSAQPAIPVRTQPVVASAPQPIASTGQDIVIGAPQKTKKWKAVLLWLGLIIILALVIVVVWLTTSNNSKIKKENAEELVSLLGWASFTGQCPNVTGRVDDLTYPIVLYSEDADACLNDGNRVQELLAEAKNYSSDQEYQKVYNDLMSAVSNTVVLGEDLQNAISIYKAWHAWEVETEDMPGYQAEYEIDDLAKILEDSGNDILIDYASKWKDARKKLVEADLLFTAGSSIATIIDSYDIAKNEYDLLITNEPAISELVKLSENPEGGDELLLALLKYEQYVKDNL